MYIPLPLFSFYVCVPPVKVLVKEPGSIGGQQFIVEECSECDVYLLDHTAALAIDVCVDCRIFAGPCESRYIHDTSKVLRPWLIALPLPHGSTGLSPIGRILLHITTKIIPKLTANGMVVVPLYEQCRCVPAGNTGTTAATGTTLHTSTACCSHICQAISQALYRATGTAQPAL